MGSLFFGPDMEIVLEWVLRLALAISGLSVLALAVMMFVGRWQHAVRQREKNRRRALLHNDVRHLEARRQANSQAAKAKKVR